MSESFVDLAYRGLSLGRRIRLSQIQSGSGFLELPAPMPVGTKISIAADGGVTIDAVVTQIHEQVGGSDRAPGMVIAPALADGAAAAWWHERVVLPEGVAPESRAAPAAAAPAMEEPAAAALAVAAPAAAAPATEEPAAAAPAAAAPAAEEPAVAAPAAAAPAAAAPVAAAPAEEPVATEAPAAALDAEALGVGDTPLVDDGKRTVMMQSVDLHALGLEAGASGQFTASAVMAAVTEADVGERGAAEGSESEAAGAAAADSAGERDEPRPPVVPDSGGKAAGKKRKKRR
ncbi:MAG TPA: hypothetical protein VNO30_05055 [Kofleriaceae bacterium]|nr:hypothetical protein [Kofleriaceae bacterium]